MSEWIDAALIASERELKPYLDNLSQNEFDTLVSSLCNALGITERQLRMGMLRLLIERARPLVLPSALWRRPLDGTTSILEEARNHLTALGVDAPQARLAAMQHLYRRFASERRKVPVTEETLEAQSYKCAICGLKFYNEELEALGIVSPFNLRGTAKNDPLKPHWGDLKYRMPTVDHIWPIALYGDNQGTNTAIVCYGCNQGKANYICVEQSRPFVGLPSRSALRERGPLTFETFFAQIVRQPQCHISNRGQGEVELTVELKDTNGPLVLDNLRTVGSDD